jgi:dienelactone hydrolase
MAAPATPASVLVGGVDYRLTWPARVAPRPGVVLLLHQRLGSCGDLEALAERVSALGLLAVRWDAANHGARTVRAGANDHWLNGNLDSSIDMLSQMHATVAETRLWLDFGPAKLRLAFGAVGVLGLSQGAHSALLIAANEPRVDVCVAVLGAADYEMNMRLRHATFSKVLERRRSGGVLPALA